MKSLKTIFALAIVLASVSYSFAAIPVSLQPMTPHTYNQDGDRVWRVDPAGNSNVILNDQTTPAIFVKASQVTNTTTLTAQVNLDDKIISVASTTGISVGSYIGIFNLATNRFYAGYVVSINVLDLTMDSLVDSTFEIGATVGVGITNMAVDGSVTPQVFTVRGADPGIQVTADITRIIIDCVATNPVDLLNFCGETALTNGIQMRFKNGATFNLLNWKTGADLAGSMYDWQVYSATNPQQGVDGFVARLTFGGASKIGVVIRLAPGEEIEYIIADDLSGAIHLEIMNEGHIVQ